MVGTIDLYSLALTPNDTMYFDSVNAQTQWFNERQHLTIDNVSFNGARAFQLGNNYLDIIFQYNYVRYQLNGRYIYAFIENVDYTNDNCCSLQVSIDLNQTFLQELQTALATSNIGNTTEKDSYFKENYKPYDNKISVPFYKSTNIGRLNSLTIDLDEYDLSGTMIIGQIILNISSDIHYHKNNDNYINSELLTDNGYKSNVYCYAFPIVYDTTKRKILNANFQAQYRTGISSITIDLVSASQFHNFIEEYGSFIESGCVSISFEQICDFDSVISYNNATNTFLLHDSYNPLQPAIVRNPQKQQYVIASKHNASGDIYPFGTDKYIVNIYNNVTTLVKEFNLSNVLQNIPYALRRQPYLYIRIGNDKDYITLNLAEFENNNDNNILTVEYFTSCMYPFTTNLKFYYNNGNYIDRNALFNLCMTIPVPYTLSAWQQYYAQNQASINDGLATKQSYERKEQAITTAGNMVTGTIDIATSLIPFTKAGNFYKYAGAKNNRISDKSIINATTSGVGMIVGAVTEWANSELEREKERKLLEISWNDIKSSPSEYANSMSNMTVLYRNGIQNIEIDLYIASNINDIIKYHKQYGYKVNRMENLTWQSLKKHTVFDFISFNTITLKSTLPQFYIAQIEQHYEQGVRFWYDYNNFMNFEIENREIA